jgi:hypothetical protein
MARLMQPEEITGPADLERALQQLRTLAESSEEDAHLWEDKVHSRILLLIAEGRGFTREEMQAMAAAAFRTKEINFTRWYA